MCFCVLTINIVTKYADAEKGFSKVAGSLTKYRNELLKANAEGNRTEVREARLCFQMLKTSRWSPRPRQTQSSDVLFHRVVPCPIVFSDYDPYLSLLHRDEKQK